MALPDHSPRVAVVTGATSGIGEATTRRLAADGWRVIATGRRRERLEALAVELPEGACLPVAFDIADDRDRAKGLEAILAQAPRVDLLVNNAGLALGTEAAQDADAAHWRTMVETNVTGLMETVRVLLPAIRQASGLIVNLSSVAATYPYLGGNVYGATKAFVRQFSLGLHCDLRGTGVRSTSLEPGMVRTEFAGIRRGDAEAGRRFYADAGALEAEDVAGVVAWLANLPPHVNINALEIMPTRQSWAGFHIEPETP